ncbi:MAG TPA: histone deacetylase [Terriglobales bacterium]|nr:histone deacetylase [Terriglobales bacterium]
MRRIHYCDVHPIDLPPGHRFPSGKYSLIRKELEADGFELQPAPLAAIELIKLVHSERYVDDFIAGLLSPATIRRIGFPWSEGLVRRTLTSLGGTLAAAEDALSFGWGANLAGGTHHAFADEGAGYCVFNDLAVAIEWLKRNGRIRRAAVIDLDVHQGDGTAKIFSDDPDVMTVSLHGQSNFPLRKQESTIDIELPDGTEDREYLAAVDFVLPQILSFRPDIILYQSGVDGLDSDRLGHLSLSQRGLQERDLRVMHAARSHSIPFVITLGGGYSIPIALSAEAHANVYRTASSVFE